MAQKQRASFDLTSRFRPSAASAPAVARTGATPDPRSPRPVAERIADALDPRAFADRPLLLSIFTALAFSNYYFPYSNQHSYFLHLIGRWGDQPLLRRDWFYNTTEPYIFFNYLHTLPFSVPELVPFIIFILFILVLSLGFFSIYRVLAEGFNVPVWFSAAFLLILCNPSVTLFIEKYTIAPAFFLGGIANQSLFYPPPLFYQPSSLAWLYFLALWLIVQSRFTSAFVISAFIALMHPIMLASSFFFFCALMTGLWRDVQLNKMVLWSLISFAIVLPTLIYHTASNYAFEPSEIALARHIMLDVRTPHETEIREWFGYDDALRLSLIGFGVLVAITHQLWDRLVVRVFLTFTVLSVAASVLTFATGNETMRLAQPWRASIVYLPVLTVFSIWILVGSIASRLLGSRIVRGVMTCAMAASLLSPVVISYKLYMYQRSDERWSFYERLKGLHDEQAVLAHMPRSFDDVRLGAGLPIFVDFKSPAFAVGDLIEWDRRVRLLESIDFSQCEQTAAKMRQERIGFFLFDKRLDEKQLSEIAQCGLEPELQSDKFAVYRIDGR